MMDLTKLSYSNIIYNQRYFAVFIFGRKLQPSISFWSTVSLSFLRFSSLFREYCEERLYTFYPRFSPCRTRMLILALDLELPI